MFSNDIDIKFSHAIKDENGNKFLKKRQNLRNKRIA